MKRPLFAVIVVALAFALAAYGAWVAHQPYKVTGTMLLKRKQEDKFVKERPKSVNAQSGAATPSPNLASPSSQEKSN